MTLPLNRSSRSSFPIRWADLAIAEVDFGFVPPGSPLPGDADLVILPGSKSTLADLAFDLRLERRAMKQEIRAILSPEQREESARMEGRMEGMRRSHRGEREGQEDGHATPQAPCCPTPAR